MRLQEVQHIDKKSWTNDVVLGDQPGDPLTADDLIGTSFEVWQYSTLIFVQDHEALPGCGHTQTQFRKVRRKRGNGQKTDVYVYNDGGIPTRYFIEV
jgi:hypothetical protein